MTTRLIPYIQFAGAAREAMTFYQEVFGGELTISTFGDFGMPGADPSHVMHSELKADGFDLMGADGLEPDQVVGETRISAAFMSDEVERVLGWFARFSDGGTVRQPLEKQVWGDMYGEVTDRFGVRWMFNVALPGDDDPLA